MNAEKNINLLSKLLAEPRNDVVGNNEQKFDNILEVFTKEFSPLLSSSVYDSKSKVIKELKEVFEILEAILLIPDIIGKNLIAIFTDRHSAKYDIFNTIFKNQCEYMDYNNNLPCIILDSNEKSITAINIFGNTVNLQDDEYYYTNKELYKSNVDIRKCINLFKITEPLNFTNTAFIYLPYYVQHNKFLKSILQFVNSAVIIGNQTNCDNMLQDIYCVDYLKLSSSTRGGLSSTSKKKLKLWLGVKNNKSYNIPFSIKMNLIFTRMLRQLKKKFNECTLLHEMFVEESVFTDDENVIREFISEQKKNLYDVKNRTKADIENMKKIFLQIIKEVEEIENSLIIDDSKMMIDERVESNLLTLAVEKYLLGEIDSCHNCVNKLVQYNSKRYYLIDLYMKSIENRFLSKEEFMMLEYEKADIDFIKELKLKYRKEINISKTEMRDLYSSALRLSNISADIYDEIGDYFFANASKIKAEDFYFKAMELGKTDCKNKILRMSSDNLPKVKRKLLELFDSDEIYSLGKEKVDSSQGYGRGSKKRRELYEEGYANICIAVSLGHNKALEYLTEIYFDKIDNKRNKHNDRDINICIGLSQTLISKNIACNLNYYRLGYLNELKNNMIKAEEYYSKSDIDLAYYRLGLMYLHKEKPTKSALKKARSFFKKAVELGCTRASVEITNVRKLEEELDEKIRKSKESREEQVVSSEVVDDGFCFVTTATMYALGKGDESAELKELHNLRDKFLLCDNQGELLLKEYYRVAPELVKKVNQLHNSEEVYKEIFKKYIKLTYEFSLKGEEKKAKDIYIKMMLYLCDQYDVKISEDVLVTLNSSSIECSDIL